MNDMWYLFSAYLIIWVAIWGYTLRLGVRQRRLMKEIDFLKARLSEDNDRLEPGEPS